MKSWIFGAITVACMTIGSAALACGTASDVRPTPTPRPSPVQNVSFQASEMMERASRLENTAAQREQQARIFDQEAENLAMRSRSLRQQAQLVNAADRSSIMDIADELAQRAANDRAQAMRERSTAQELRLEASNLRQRAVALVKFNNGGGGWKGRSTTSVPSTPIPSERGVTL